MLFETKNIAISVSKFSTAPPAFNTRSQFKGKTVNSTKRCLGTLGSYRKLWETRVL